MVVPILIMDWSSKTVKRIAWFLFVPVINFIIKDTENQWIIYKIRQSFINKIIESLSKKYSDKIITVIDAGNAGTAYRFLIAALCITPGKWLLTSSKRMKQRPIKPLVEIENKAIEIASMIKGLINAIYKSI